MGVDNRRREAVLDRLADIVAGIRLPHVVRVALDGGDAAGKTTLADELRPLVEERGPFCGRRSTGSTGRGRSDTVAGRPRRRATTSTPSTTQRSARTYWSR